MAREPGDERGVAEQPAPSASGRVRRRRRGLASRLAALRDSDLWQSFIASRLVVAAAILSTLLIGAAFLAPLIAPHNPYDLKSLELIDADRPPAWEEGGDARFLLGTDDQGRDILSTIMYGTRASLMIGFCSVLLAVAIGLSLGLWAGYAGGRIDAAIMRVADVQLTFPAILTALLIDGVALAIFKRYTFEGGKFWILVMAIGLSYWVQYARTVRGVTLVERDKEYVQAARLIGIGPMKIMFQHILPNVHGTGAGAGHHQPGARHHHRGDAVVPGRRAAAHRALARHHDPGRQQVSVLGLVVDGGVSGTDAGAAGGGRELCLAIGCAMRSIPSYDDACEG